MQSEAEWQVFKANRNNEAFLDRISVVSVPYVLRVTEETGIYKKLLKASQLDSMPCAPETLEMLAKFCLRPLCFRLLDAVFAILLAVLCGWAATASAAPAKAPEGSLPTLTTTQQVHSLSSEEAKRAGALKKELADKIKAEPAGASRLVQGWMRESKAK